MQRTTNNTIGLRRLVVTGMLTGIIMFLGLTGLGFIVVPPVKATIMHIPVIIGAIIEGPIVGAATGLCFGLFSMYQAFTAPTPTSFLFWNPLIALVPRMLIGVVSYYVYAALVKKFPKAAIGAGALFGALISTVTVLGLAYILYAERFANAININPSTVGKVLMTAGVTNGVPEALISVLVCVPVVTILKKIRK